MTMLWQYSVIASRAHAEKALRKEENKGWHNLGPESSSRLEDAFQFARMGEVFFITFAPCIAYKMSVEKMFPSGMEMKQTGSKPLCCLWTSRMRWMKMPIGVIFPSP